MWKAQALASSLAHLRWRRAAVAIPRSACPSSPKGSKRPQSHRRRTRRLLSELDDRFVTLRTVAVAMLRNQRRRTAALALTRTQHPRAALAASAPRSAMSPRVHNAVLASLKSTKLSRLANATWAFFFRGRSRCLKALRGEETHVAAAGTAQAAPHAVVHRPPRLYRRHRRRLALSKSSFNACRTTGVLRLLLNSRPARFLSDPACHIAKLPDHGTSAVPV